MIVHDRNILDRFCVDFCAVVEQFVPYIVVSGFVAISSGRTRGTEDIDMIIAPMPSSKFSSLHEALLAAGFECIQSADSAVIHEYLSAKTSVRYVWKDALLPEMEVKFAKDALDEYQLQTRTKLPLTGLSIWFSNINVNIAFKEYLLKSPKDLEDAQHLRIVYAELVDTTEIALVERMIGRLR